MGLRRGRARQGWSVGLAIGALLAVWAAGAEFPAAVQTPGLVPDRVVLGLVGDPAHGFAVAWRTEMPVEHAVVEVAPCTADASFAASVTKVRASSERLQQGGAAPAYHHAATIADLEPDRLYCYRVGDGTVWSEWSSVRTAAATAEPFRFIYLGDAQDGVKSFWSRAVRAAYAAAPDARFIVQAGDLTREGFDDALWGEWTYALGFISSQVPILAAPGNHDLHRPPGPGTDDTVWSVQPTWRAHLSLPANGPSGAADQSEETWSLDYQGVRLIALDANPYTEEDFSAEKKKQLAAVQPAWLEGRLHDNPNRWTIVVQHEPLYAVVKERDFPELRSVFRPILDRHHVDLVLTGHEHCYARSHKLNGDRVVPPSEPGTVYAVSVSGPKLRQPGPRFRELMAVERGDAQMYQVIAVSRDRLRYQAFSVTGELVDAFELTKDAAGRSTYLDLAPRLSAPSPAASAPQSP
jgi:3',5'-cyclic AMP phosphodiesterase CpdA